jgi:hypothetical protein
MQLNEPVQSVRAIPTSICNGSISHKHETPSPGGLT